MIELVGDELYQWDSYRKVKITPKRGYTISCIHFNDGSCILLNDESKDLITITNGITIATIPNTLLQQGGYNITVYAVNIKDGGIETTESRQFYVKKKTKPKDYTYEQSEVASIKSAASYATQAKASADEAKSYRDTAKTYASNASASATNASTSANSANAYATNASNSAKNASTSETNAKTYATNASNSAKNASTSETNAKTYATNASNSATNASTSANSANAYKVAAENAKNEILGHGGTYSDPKDKSALKEVRDSREAIKTIESNMNTAVEAAGKIDSFRSEITTYHTETKNARNDILSKGADGEKSVYEKIIDAETSIIGSGGTVADPKEGSALKATKDAQKAAEEAAKKAEGFAASANKGITVINDLEYNDTENALSVALSAYQGKVLNESKLNLSGGTMTGTLKLNGDPSNSNDAATKNYVDTHMPSLVTTNNDGVMSKEDKVKLDGLENALAAKVDKEDGKGLSTNDFTTDEKNKLAGLENYTLPTASDTVKGGIKVGAGLTMNGEVLSATGGGTADAVDWSNVTNKPETFAPSTHTHTASEVTELATVATSGSYNDLSDKPTDFAPAAHTHEMTDITGLSDALDDKSDMTHNHDGTYLKEVPMATKATLGGVKVGTNLSIDENGVLSADAQKMTVDSALNSNSVNPVQNKVVKNALDGKSDTTHNHDGRYLKEVPKATKNTFGVIKVGTGLSVTNDGILSADAQAINVTPLITQNSDEAVSSGAVFSRIGNLKFVVSPTPPTDADNNTFTIVVPN